MPERGGGFVGALDHQRQCRLGMLLRRFPFGCGVRRQLPLPTNRVSRSRNVCTAALEPWVPVGLSALTLKAGDCGGILRADQTRRASIARGNSRPNFDASQLRSHE